MFRGQYGIGNRGLGFRLRSSWQWQPTLTAHDPNPPIILEDPAGGGPVTLIAGSNTVTLTAPTASLVASGASVTPFRMLMGVGV